MRTLQYSLVLLFCVALAPAAYGNDLPELLEKLVATSEMGCGYSTSTSSLIFLPLGVSDLQGAMLLGNTRTVPSAPLTEIVRRGVDALPILLAHLDDERPLSIPPVSGFEWTEFADSLDRSDSETVVDPSGHVLTVGDLCFVAIGQIVNRPYQACRYAPSGGLLVCSPTHSKNVRESVISKWAGLTREKHRSMLVRDFLHPDYDSQRISAYNRLAYYYPEIVEKVVPQVLETALSEKTHPMRRNWSSQSWLIPHALVGRPKSARGRAKDGI